MAQINPIKYSKELQKQIFPNNAFYKHSVAETDVADNVTSVERPVQGELEEAQEGAPKTLPLQVQEALDDSDSYAVTLVYAPPIMIENETDYALNYNKRKTKQTQQAATIETKCADIAVTGWAPTVAGQILKTTGSSRASNVVGLTGNRKAVTKADMLKVKNALLRMNVDGMGGEMYALVTADFYTDLLAIPEFVDYDKTGNTSKLESGVVGKIMGINIMVRSNVKQHTGLLYTNAGTKKGTRTAIASSDLPGNLFWNSKMVARAEGKVKTIVNPDKAEYLGATILVSKTRFGASHARKDQLGVVALLEDTAA